MRINITAGDFLNNFLCKKYANEVFIPFCEAMNKGTYSFKLFSYDFCVQRSKIHNVTLDEYLFKLKGFLDFINNIKEYNEVILWFGDDAFCNENSKIVVKTLKEYNYNGTLILNTVDENTGEIVNSRQLV